MLQVGLFRDLLDCIFGTFENDFVEESAIGADTALKIGFPINETNFMEVIFFVFFILFHLEFVNVFLFDPFRKLLIVFHQLIFEALFDVYEHVGSGFGLKKFFCDLHLFGIKIDGFVKATEVEVEGALSGDELDMLIIEFVPLIPLLDIVEIMTGLCTGAFMNKNRVELINLFFTGSCPSPKIQLLLVLKSR